MSFFIFLLLILYIVWDLNYFLRCLFTLGYAFVFEKRRKVSDKTTINGICTTQDVDINNFNHMNNARYLRELDFAQYHYYLLTGLYDKITSRGGAAFKSANKIRYRRSIPIFTRYKVETKLIWWDDDAIYFIQKFITFDGFVRAVMMSKTRVTNLNVIDLMKEFDGERPELPKELKLWLEADEVSKESLRKDN